MPGLLNHSPAEIFHQLLVDFALAADPTTTGSWPAYIDVEPDRPDNVITVTGTAAIHQGRFQISGEVQERDGIQIRLRCVGYDIGYAKIQNIAIALDELVYANGVTVDGRTYVVHSWSRTSGPLHLGLQVPDTKRDIFTLNGTIHVR